MLSKLPPAVCLRGGGGGGGGATGLLNKGGGSNRLPVEFPQVQTSLLLLLYPDDNNHVYVCNITHPIQLDMGSIIEPLISGLFHLKLGASRCLVLSMLGKGVEQQASCLVAKQAVEFPQVLTSTHYYDMTLHVY